MADDQNARMSSASGRSSTSRRQTNPQQQVSQIEKSVTHLLVATKQLLETLTQWSRQNASDGDVSDVYVRLGYEFNIACRAFQAIGIPTDDLGPVPELLRTILEETLSHDASQASLDEYLPRIRDIIISLLQGLKKKQARLRSGRPTTREAGAPSARQTSVGSNASGSQSADKDEGSSAAQSDARSSAPHRALSGDALGEAADLPPRTSSRGRASPTKMDGLPSNPRVSRAQPRNRDDAGSSESSLSSNAAQNIPVVAPYPSDDQMPQPGTEQAQGQPPSSHLAPYEETIPRPPPVPKQQDALAQLQRGGELERRASRRFSAYQIQKHLGTSSNGIPMMPPPQNGPIPNRGRDVRESMNALRNRGSGASAPNRQRTSQRPPGEQSPSRVNTQRKPADDSNPISTPSGQPAAELPADTRQETDAITEKIVHVPVGDDVSPVVVSATITTPIDDPVDPAVQQGYEPQGKASRPETQVPQRSQSRKTATPPPTNPPQFVPDQSPQPGQELTLFLQYKSKIKKLVLPDGYDDLTIGRLQLAFIEKFSWNTHSNGIDLPEIYIQDPVSGVRHELEDLADIKDRCVLVLNVEALDEVKRHIDEGLDNLKDIVSGIRTAMDDQQLAIQRVSERQQDAAKEIASIAAAPTITSARVSMLREPSPGSGRAVIDAKDAAAQLDEVQTLRRDLAVVRQTYQSFVADVESSMSNVRSKAKAIKTAAVDATIPKLGDGDSGRTYIVSDKKKLDDDCETVINRVEELQDVVEDLRKDVVTRGVRPLPRQLEDVERDISSATNEVQRLREVVKKAAPRWKRVWERELQVVCEEQEALSMQEALMSDLSNDLEDSANTFALVQEATRQQNLMQDKAGPGAATNGASGNRSASGKLQNALALDQAADPHKAKDTMLGAVRALQVNHEERLEAIERAEKARKRELATRMDGEFKRELGKFVEDGKLKKTGGVEEAERMRLAREEQARKDIWEQKAAREVAREEKRKQKAAERAAARAAAATEGQGADDGTANDQAADAPHDPSQDATVNGGEAPPA